MTYFLDVYIGGGVVNTGIWSRNFVEKFRVVFKVCVRTDRRWEGVGQMRTGMDRGRGWKITENVRIFVMDGLLLI